MTSYTIPPDIEKWINSQLSIEGTTLANANSLAQNIKNMSDFYVSSPLAVTPWLQSWCRQAQIAYYFPLNFLRNLRIFQELQDINFFPHSINWFELGVGLGPSLEAFLRLRNPNIEIQQSCLVEQSAKARELCDDRWRALHNFQGNWKSQLPRNLGPQSFLILSYSLTELDKIPDVIWSAENILVIEPSTREDGRRLMSLREDGIERGFSAVAPCTHSRECPLLTKSKRDWCHDRFSFNRPEWMLEIERHLPFINNTLTTSYLALTKNKNSIAQTKYISKARVVGDFLNEKGKSRQLICRNNQREFISFIKKEHQPIEFFRGDILEFNETVERRGEELRISPENIKLLRPKKH